MAKKKDPRHKDKIHSDKKRKNAKRKKEKVDKDFLSNLIARTKKHQNFLKRLQHVDYKKLHQEHTI